jgi:hypothetical protein
LPGCTHAAEVDLGFGDAKRKQIDSVAGLGAGDPIGESAGFFIERPCLIE